MEDRQKPTDEVSLFQLAGSLLQHRWRIARWMMYGGAIATVFALLTPPQFAAYASFTVQSSDVGRSGLASLAGQFGIAVPSSSQSASPDFFAMLLKSRVLLRQVARDTIAVRELGDRRTTLPELFDIRGMTPAQREDRSILRLGEITSASVAKTTEVVSVQALTRWPSVSLAIVSRLVDGVNKYNLRTRQGQAALERKFIQSRLALADTELKRAEDQLKNFLTRNRQYTNSADLSFERDRLQRDIGLKQQTFTTLTQGYEDARIREVRETPAITVLEPPTAASEPEPRGRVIRVLMGMALGATVGAFLVLIGDALARHRADPESGAFFHALSDLRAETLGRFSKQRSRAG
jgi:uncharacterized protein involved in exopolysaccharide biosynthesis